MVKCLFGLRIPSIVHILINQFVTTPFHPKQDKIIRNFPGDLDGFVREKGSGDEENPSFFCEKPVDKGDRYFCGKEYQGKNDKQFP
jgi:hypothetical protein